MTKPDPAAWTARDERIYQAERSAAGGGRTTDAYTGPRDAAVTPFDGICRMDAADGEHWMTTDGEWFRLGAPRTSCGWVRCVNPKHRR